MNSTIISRKDVLAEVIHANYGVLVVLGRMGIKLGVGNKTIQEVAQQHHIDTGALVLILNLFCNDKYVPAVREQFEFIPDILLYLKNSHAHFLEENIPALQQNITQLVRILHDTKAELVEQFYNNYIMEMTQHIEYENETVFPYVAQMYDAFLNKRDPGLLSKEYDIDIYDEHHDDIEDVLTDLKNILIRHLPQVEHGKVRRNVLRQLFELESDLYSHTRIEDEVLIPLVKNLENILAPVVPG